MQQRYHNRLQFRTDTTTIKTDTINILRIQLRKEFATQNLSYDRPVLMEGIDALRMETLYRARSRLQGPVGLSTTTICYQYHGAKVRKKVKNEKGKVKNLLLHIKIMNYAL